MTYDARDRVVDTIDALGFIVSRVVYTENDLRKEVFIQNPENSFVPAPGHDNLVLSQRFEYNDRNEVKKEFDAFGHFVESFYDENGNLVLRIDEAGVRTTFEYGALDRLIRQVQDEGPGRLNITTRFEYDANGNRTAVIDPKGFRYEFAYDQANRMIELRYPMLSEGTQHREFWGYDRFGRLHFHLNANGKLACFEYDLLNRLVKETHGDPFDVKIVREYDSAGNLCRIADGTIDALRARRAQPPDAGGLVHRGRALPVAVVPLRRRLEPHEDGRTRAWRGHAVQLRRRQSAGRYPPDRAGGKPYAPHDPACLHMGRPSRAKGAGQRRSRNPRL